MLHDLSVEAYNQGYRAGLQAAQQQHNKEERRFTATVAAMQRIVSRPDTHDDTDVCWCARTAVQYADALLKELEK